MQKDCTKFSFYVGLNHQETSLVAMQAYKKQAGPFLLRSITSIFSVLISVVADSPKGEAVTNQKYNKICDILSFIKCKTCDIHAVKKSLEIRLLLYSVGKTARTSLPCSNALTP